MFGMGWQEILIILVIAVLVIGPEQLPQVARTLGKLMAQFRRVSNDLRDTINKEFKETEEFKDFQEFSRGLDSEVRSVGYSAQEYVEKEVAKEEAEFKRLEEEVKAIGDDAGPPTDAKSAQETAAGWIPDRRDVPGEAVAGAAEPATDPATQQEPVLQEPGTVPQETVPQETVPQETVPQETVPQDTAFQDTEETRKESA